MSSPALRLPLGISDFRELREGNFTYVDKTALIDDILAESTPALLIPRPRSFGKTLNLSMLRCFLEKRPDDLRPLFAGLVVASSERAWAHFQRYPVIFVTFQDVQSPSWEACLAGIANALARTFGEHRYLLTEGNLYPEDARRFTAILERRATQPDLVTALDLLSRLLRKHHRERVVILIDGCDTPVRAGHVHQYDEEVSAFFAGFLSGGLKDNADLFKGVLTGVLPITWETWYSGLNLGVFSLLRTRLASAFGFTEPEVRGLLHVAGVPAALDGLRATYGGYRFGGQAIYNPWSVLSFLDRGDDIFRTYWSDPSALDLVRERLITGPRGVSAELATLLAGGTLDQYVDETIALRDLARGSDTLWSVLLFTGYLTAVRVSLVDGEQHAHLALPNGEVTVALADMAQAFGGGSARGRRAERG